MRQENLSCLDLRELHSRFQQGQLDRAVYSVQEGLVYFRKNLLISRHSNLKKQLLHEFNATRVGGHTGVDRTHFRLGVNFFWQGMRQDVNQFFTACSTCQARKYSP